MGAIRVFLLFSVFVSIAHGQINRTVDKDSISSLHSIAKELSSQRKFNDALVKGQTALKHASFIENDSLIAESYRTLGIIYIRMDYGKLAIENYWNSISYYERSDNQKGLMKIYNNIGYYLFKQKKYEEAEKQLRQSLALSENFTEDLSSIYPKYNIGQLYLERKKYRKANDCFDKVIVYCDTSINYSTSSKILPTAYYFKGQALFGQKKVKEAIIAYSKLVKLCDEDDPNYYELLSLAYENLLKIYKIQGNKTGELEVLEKHIHFYELHKLKQKDKTFEEILLKYGIDEYESRLEVIEEDRKLKEDYINWYDKLIYVLIVSLFILLLFTGFFYLNQRWRIRTNALLSGQNRQLFEAKKQIENVSKIRSNFFSLISHELRTPLYAIIGMTNLLLLEKPEKYQERYLKSLKFSGEHLLAIINNILQMNKIEASKMNTVEEIVDLKKSIQNVITSVSFLVKENKNNIEIQFDEEIPDQLLGDSLKISQVLFNLLDNAVRYTYDGNVTLAIIKVGETSETVRLKFLIKDDGLGIPQQKKHIIFENLEKGVVLSEDNGYLDLGLGLTTVNNLLKVLKSKLHLKSVLNEGSEFYFELELIKGEDEETEETSFDIKSYDFEGLNILIVDDNAVNGLLTQKILERRQIKTKVVHSGFSALDILDKQEFDLILMDMFMPKLNGIETIEKIRENNNHIPIILLTAMEISEAYAKVVNTEISGVISKPFDPEILYDKIDNVIQSFNEE
ncbi:response regulator [uncultured Kordia sp.]|uniref:tetratricopeptide repeat-containing hybrid sensor histidine kinase/response regulator n=1 Tax=uncultured Kordia sp. TaxID=507699 RepID=UPI0026049DDF|nr:response regulator [uncultured Kordia sp.]